MIIGKPENTMQLKKMVSHNNYAERPFAVVKAFARMYPSLSLRNLSALTHSIINGTHRCAEKIGNRNALEPVTTRIAGIALTAHPNLKRAVNLLCSVRPKSLGAVTIQLRKAHKQDKKAHIANRKAKAILKYKALIRQQAATAAKRDKAEMTANSDLCNDLVEMSHHLKSRCNSKPARVTFLKEQVYARISCENPRLYPCLGPEWRKLGGKIRVSAQSKDQSDEDYLTLLLAAMIKEDNRTLGVNNNNQMSFTQEYIRVLPSIALEFTNPIALAYKKEFANTVAELAKPVDDPIYMALHAKYHGLILYDNETRASHKLFRIAFIQFVRSYSKARHNCWEATCEQV